MSNLFDNHSGIDMQDLVRVMGTKESGYYSLRGNLSNITIYPEIDGGKGGRRKYVDIGALPNAAGTSTTAHGINFTRTIRIYGTADNLTTGDSIPIPYSSSTANDIVELKIDGTNIYIIVGKDMSAYTARVCIDYLL